MLMSSSNVTSSAYVLLVTAALVSLATECMELVSTARHLSSGQVKTLRNVVDGPISMLFFRRST